jgi:shikimate kinase
MKLPTASGGVSSGIAPSCLVVAFSEDGSQPASAFATRHSAASARRRFALMSFVAVHLAIHPCGPQGILAKANSMNIVIIGYRCTGKTAVGRVLADELGMNFVDTDVLIEEDAGEPIEIIISTKRWDHFRNLERDLIDKISKQDNQVIATGGGVVINQENVKTLKRDGWVVWLDAEPDAVKERMKKEQQSGNIRPSLTGADPLAEIEEVMNVRRPMYQEAGDFMVDTTRLSEPEAAMLIMKNLPAQLRAKKG